MEGGLAHSRLCFRDWLNSYLQAPTSCLCNLACLSFQSQLPTEMAHTVPAGHKPQSPVFESSQPPSVSGCSDSCPQSGLTGQAHLNFPAVLESSHGTGFPQEPLL